MDNYIYNQKRHMNRAERRKNGIGNSKMSHKYTRDELEKILKSELERLINEPYSETVKREKYKKLELLIEEYKKRECNQQLEKNRKRPNRSTQNHATKYQTQKAISAYQVQSEFSKNNVKNVKKEGAKSVQKAKSNKKGFFAKIAEFFAPKNTTSTKTIKKPNTSAVTDTRRYTNAQSKTNYRYNEFEKSLRYSLDESQDNIYKEFEKVLNNYNQYRKENKNYHYIKNGREVRYQPRCL